MKPSNPDNRNLFIAMILASILIVAWQIFIETPKRQEMARWKAEQDRKEELLKTQQKAIGVDSSGTIAVTDMKRDERLSQAARLPIASDTLRGSIQLKGLRFDDLVLTNYKAHLEHEDPLYTSKRFAEHVNASEDNRVVLLSPAGGKDAYFMQIGWLGEGVKLPDANSVWQSDNKELNANTPATFRWDNGDGVRFIVTVALDRDYMFTLTQRIENNSGRDIKLTPYAFLNRAYDDSTNMHNYILHEGPLGVLTGALSEVSYATLREDGPESFNNASGWLGITDKYWLTALIPDQNNFNAKFSYYKSGAQDRYQTEYTAAPITVGSGSAQEMSMRFFAGAKVLQALDRYATGGAQANNQPPVPLFDRAVDFGSLYFLTKPMFLLLSFFYSLVGNFGIAIVLLTLVVKLLMYPMANKGYRAAAAMRALQPEMMRIKETAGSDRLRMQQEMMALYKREKVNPAAGCLPILIQIPVFFALYKVLFVSIEMRHAPFVGWIHDLSAADPSNVFNLFGLIPVALPAFLHLGLLPILMCATSVIQMRQQPKPTDPTQAKMMKIMPYMFLVIFAQMPAGLVLYWTCSNMLSILQQWLITRRYRIEHPEKAAALK